jgi:hypothetical protein
MAESKTILHIDHFRQQEGLAYLLMYPYSDVVKSDVRWRIPMYQQISPLSTKKPQGV